MIQLIVTSITILTFVFFPFTVVGAVTLSLVTDTTPGGDYIVGGGKTFDKDFPGIEIELYRLVAEKLGLELIIKRMPWKLCLQKLAANQVNGIFPASFKRKRLDIGKYPMNGNEVDKTRKTRDNAYYLYSLKGSGLTWDGEQISGQEKDIGAPLGWAIVDDMRQKGVHIHEVPIHENSPRLLVQKKLHGFICLETVFDNYLSKNPEEFADILKESIPIWEKPYYLMLSEEFVSAHPEVSEAIWNTVRDIKNSDDFRSLIDKYSNR